MLRLDDVSDLQRACYSHAQIDHMFGIEVADAVCKANEGVPIWPKSLLNFMIGWCS